jgi:bacterioferritin
MSNDLITMLNNVLNYEHQYFINSKILKDNGLYKLSELARKNSISEMHHVDKIMDRIFYLKGLPKILKVSELNFSNDINEIFKQSLELEKNSVKLYQSYVGKFEEHHDYGSSALLRELINDEENHIDWLEQQFELIKKISLELYLEKNG